jgi:anti-sigma regulatory factor (Ser/Thr protein kinase)
VIPRDLDLTATRDEASVVVMRARARDLALAQGLAAEDAERVAVVTSELGHNQLRHARGGAIAAAPIERGGVAGVELWAIDEGDGIVDARRAFAEGAGAGPSLGVGLGGVCRLSDEVDFDVRLGIGTVIRARKFAAPPAQKSEVAVLVAPYPGERVSGDGAAIVRNGERVLVAAIDALGHGPLAHDAADVAEGVLLEASGGLLEILAAMDSRLEGTRGAAVSLFSLDLTTRELEHASLGNLVARVCRADGAEALVGRAGTLGSRSRVKPRLERARLEAGEVLLIFSDGVKRAATLASEPLLLNESPLVMAQHVMSTYARGHDDGLVVVVR